VAVIQTIDISGIDNSPYGLTTDGKFLWFTGQQNTRVYQIDKQGNLISSFGVTTTPYDMATDGKFLWVILFQFPAISVINQYDKTGNLISSIDLAALGFLFTEGLTTDGKFLWFSCPTWNLRQISKTGDLINLLNPVAEAQGLTTDKKFIWFTYSDDSAAGFIAQMDKAGNRIQTINVSATDKLPKGITTDGKFLWWIGSKNDILVQSDKT